MSNLEKEEVTKEKSGNWKNILIIVLLVVIAGLVGYISFNAGKELAEIEDKIEENDNVKENDDNNENNNDANTDINSNDNNENGSNGNQEVVPTDEELISRSKTLKDNFGTLLSGGYTVETKTSRFSELSMEVYKITDTSKFVATIDDTFVNHATAWKYVPYYEKNGVYYSANGSGGFMGAGNFIFEYYVRAKTATTANISIAYIECYDTEVHSEISQCKNNPWGTTNGIELNLSKVNGKWLIESMTSDKTQSLLK